LNAQKQLTNRTHKLIFTPETEFKTHDFTVRFVANNTIKTTFAAQRKNDTLTIYFKPDTDFKTNQSQLVITRILTHFLRIEATAFLPSRLKLLADTHGFQYTSLKINSARRRWGSCSAKKQINLSLYLMLLPEELIDFVIVHELCHTREMNHSERRSRNHATAERPLGNRRYPQSSGRRIGSQRPHLGRARRLERHSGTDGYGNRLPELYPGEGYAGNSKKHSLIKNRYDKRKTGQGFGFALFFYARPTQ
jgi:hypothetical protein